LINYTKVKDNKYYEDDYCDFKMSVIDAGEDTIIARILRKLFLYNKKLIVNDSKIENHIQGDFFLPLFDYSKIMIAGSGQACVLKKFNIKAFCKFGIQLNSEAKNCECCTIY